MNFLSKLIVLLAIATISWGCNNFLPPTGPTPPPSGPGPAPNPILSAPPPVSGISITDAITETNNQRKINGVASLSENSKLNAAADFKMRDMFARQYFDHYAPDGTSGVPELLARFNYKYMATGENLAYGNFKNANELVSLWMASPGHRANILNSAYREIGVATGYGVFQGRRTIIAVQIFGTPY